MTRTEILKEMNRLANMLQELDGDHKVERTISEGMEVMKFTLNLNYSVSYDKDEALEVAETINEDCFQY
ncbi:hypothetical protein [Fusobacterium necrophorum]|uniref:Uncharacterized protein n=2 Tax=Fusobacterium necrophorum TaxID=859 RepID=A0AAN4ATT9_9FUSO|nr:hypothetical protein [Fusobacterium necrophorum]AYV94703.1 hypothetical protein BWX37_03315 [Fusobacterium necrophorum subsp. funduliforme]EJU18769.1 hypothetical protein HMPREF1127_1071 [Fusobacterium necrophorum subsp. funduliforme Fnf 1007]KYL02947.1 hypothetical protein A2J06_09820 [Fusobacterium necrophorum subsp. funduliforme]KYM37681.1 hypothetical protein A2U03_10715 [Fusobacterium necrophorum subsp. funduliforme]KYM52192.1 hypothetical protein A2U04_10255 [Fusobacterium necrophorum